MLVRSPVGESGYQMTQAQNTGHLNTQALHGEYVEEMVVKT
jgi:hypothetical protein